MLSNLTIKKDVKTLSICPENLTGEKGKGGMAIEGSASYAARELGQGWKVNPYLTVEAGKTLVLANFKGQGAIKHIWITDDAPQGRLFLLKIYFDGQKYPNVCVPLSDFFLNADYQEFRQISSMPICFNPSKAMNCYFEMPFFKEFKIEIENLGVENYHVYYQIDFEEKQIPLNSLYFNARFNRVNPLPYKENYVILDTVKGIGAYVGTYFHWGVKSNRWWGEGEVKFFIDGDTDFPTICGTGTEDYICGAYNFDVNGKYQEFSTLYSGLSKVNDIDGLYKVQRYFDTYRFHIVDPIYFKKDIKVTVQALGWRSNGRYLPLQDDISSVAYFYSDTLNDKDIFKFTANDIEII